MNTVKVASGVLAGLAIGTVLGILFAPEKGSTTRKQIMDKGDDYLNKLKSKYSDLADSVKNQFESVKQEATDLAEKGKEKYDNVKKEVQNTIVSDIKNI